MKGPFGYGVALHGPHCETHRMPAAFETLSFRQRAAAYVLRSRAGSGRIEVLVILHSDAPEAGVQVPGGGALPHETIGEAALREAHEETGAAGLVFEEVIGSVLLASLSDRGSRRLDTYSLLSTTEHRDAWDHVVTGDDGDHGMRFRCEFRPVASAGIDWGLDRHLGLAARRFVSAYARRAGRTVSGASLGASGEA